MSEAYSHIKKLIEVDDVNRANDLIALGWVLLGVHQHSGMKAGRARSYTVYVLGHTSDDPPELVARDDFDFDFDTSSLR
jgi:hypothetical protein